MSKSNISKKLSKFSKKELDSFFQNAISIHKSQAFTILSNSSPQDFGRVLIIVPKKYGNAPERNLIRRRFKSIFWEQKLYEKQKDIAIIVRPTAKNYSFNELKSLLLNAIT